VASTHTSVRPTGPLVADRGANSCYPSPLRPLGIRVEGANGPTNARAGGILPSSKGKARTSPSILRSIGEKEGLRSPVRIILTTHQCSSAGPMMQSVLVGTLSIVDLQGRNDS
jgi:hypothetical protein